MKQDLDGFDFDFRVEDKMGLLKERDQTIVTLETEISEVFYHKSKTPKIFRCLSISNTFPGELVPVSDFGLALSFQLFLIRSKQVISKLNLLQSEKGRLIQNESVSS